MHLSLPEWAQQRGWTYQAGGGGAWMNRLPGGGAGSVRERRVTQQVTGVVDGREVIIADFLYKAFYKSSKGNSTETTLLAVAIIKLTGHPADVTVHHRALGGFGAKVFATLGLDATAAHATGHKDFDRHYFVEGIDLAYGGAARMLTPDVLDTCVRDKLPGWQVHSGQLIIAWHNRPLKPATVDTLIAQSTSLAALLDSPAAG